MNDCDSGVLMRVKLKEVRAKAQRRKAEVRRERAGFNALRSAFAPLRLCAKSSSLLALIIMLLMQSLSAPQAFAQKRKKAATPSASTSNAKSITVRTEPNAIVWLDEVRRGVTDASGKLALKNVAAGRHTLRVRASGYKETSTTLTPVQRGDVAVRLLRTTDEAELLFQQAEAAREKAKDEAGRKEAAELYRSAIKLRPNFAAAHLGLARSLLDLNDYNGALEEIDAARAARPVYAEASAVEGRVLRMAADEAAAIEAFKRAIGEARGFQPEAHTGLALVYEDKGQYDVAAAELRTAIAQLSETEPVLYQLLGAIYEKQEKYKEAVAAYEKYLELAPDGSLAPAIRSVMEQLRKQAAGGTDLPY
jgi:tetratricopeptide (TPR) repeat protein